MDLSTLDVGRAADEGGVMEVRHPVTDIVLRYGPDEKPVTITLLGADSRPALKASRAIYDKRLKAAKRQQLTAALVEAEGVELLVACTIAWEGIEFKGETLDCTPVNVRKVYTAVPWLREQVDEFVGNRANFMKTSSTT